MLRVSLCALNIIKAEGRTFSRICGIKAMPHLVRIMRGSNARSRSVALMPGEWCAMVNTVYTYDIRVPFNFGTFTIYRHYIANIYGH